MIKFQTYLHEISEDYRIEFFHKLDASVDKELAAHHLCNMLNRYVIEILVNNTRIDSFFYSALELWQVYYLLVKDFLENGSYAERNDNHGEMKYILQMDKNHLKLIMKSAIFEDSFSTRECSFQEKDEFIAALIKGYLDFLSQMKIYNVEYFEKYRMKFLNELHPLLLKSEINIKIPV